MERDNFASKSSLDPLHQLTQPTLATSLPSDPTMNHPYHLIPGTSTEIILNHQGASTNMTDSCARDTVTPADLHENTWNKRHADVVLCLPAQQTRAKASNSKPTLKKRQPKSFASLSQITDSLALRPQETSTTFWTFYPTCRMLYEYVIIFLNQELMCNECKLPFAATQMPAPSEVRILKSLSDALHQSNPFLDQED